MAKLDVKLEDLDCGAAEWFHLDVSSGGPPEWMESVRHVIEELGWQFTPSVHTQIVATTPNPFIPHAISFVGLRCPRCSALAQEHAGDEAAKPSIRDVTCPKCEVSFRLGSANVERDPICEGFAIVCSCGHMEVVE